MVFTEKIGQRIFLEWRNRKLGEFVLPKRDRVLQIVTFHTNQSSLAINDEIRKTDGATLIRTKFNVSKSKKNRFIQATKTYYISGCKVKFIDNVPIREMVIQQ